ncbi:MAG: hypothetical protein M0022_06800 [Desulfobacteraceae bacterium]|nr:hypothetical protein [Desulfobacteraceae bacterium]
MEKQGRYLKVMTRDGRVLMSLFLNLGQGIVLEGQLDGQAKQEAPGNGNGGNGNGNKDELMTHPQKRYLWRILAQQGVEGNKVQEHLIKLFQVETLKEVTKIEASRMIERLLKETGGDGDGIPF